jgi:hypothetical protein
VVFTGLKQVTVALGAVIEIERRQLMLLLLLLLLLISLHLFRETSLCAKTSTVSS